jgi:hypothetical protein
MAPFALADDFSFSYRGGGITSSGSIVVQSTATPGVDAIVGISGTYADTNDAINGTITGLYNPAAVVGFTPGQDAFSSAGMSYDDLFYPDGNSPAVCVGYPFSGGELDVYGLLFNVSGGFTAGLWSDGVLPGAGLVYGAGDANNTEVLYLPTPFGEGSGQTVILSTSPTPEPGSLLLLGSGLLGLLAPLVRRNKPSAATFA